MARLRRASRATNRRRLRELRLDVVSEDFSKTYLPPRIRALLAAYPPLKTPPTGLMRRRWEALLQEKPEPWTPSKRPRRKIKVKAKPAGPVRKPPATPEEILAKLPPTHPVWTWTRRRRMQWAAAKARSRNNLRRAWRKASLKYNSTRRASKTSDGSPSS